MKGISSWYIWVYLILYSSILIMHTPYVCLLLTPPLLLLLLALGLVSVKKQDVKKLLELGIFLFSILLMTGLYVGL